jgi:D-alanyl-lipoteichoic acid acyltransferase DltB (MBOAT superfamily)
MLFNSYSFIFIFLPVTLVGFYLIRPIAGGNMALLYGFVCSVGFYAYWNVNYVPLLLFSVFVNYGIGAVILDRGHAPLGRVALFVGVAANLAALAYFKYANFLIDQIDWLSDVRLTQARIILPLAISFYTFQQIAYLVDCWRGQISENTFLRYIFLVTFFPHLIAGPIVRFREIAPQFITFAGKAQAVNLAVGLAVFIIGLTKKVLIADQFGLIASPLFVEAQKLGYIDVVSAWVASLGYTLQLYFDFSGYSDMAIGLADMFGFRLAVNFLSPYKSASIAEFWRRWHVTLSRFLRDYLYFPLGGNRAGKGRTYINLMVTMALGGLWHGAAWTFIAWGMYHGTLLALHRGWRAAAPRSWLSAVARLRPLCVVVTFLFVVVGWVLFRAPDFTTAGVILSGMARIAEFSPDLIASYPAEVYAEIAAGLLACWFLPNVYQVFYRYRPALIHTNQFGMVRPPDVRWQTMFSSVEAAALSAAFVACIYVMRSSISEFLYFMF